MNYTHPNNNKLHHLSIAACAFACLRLASVRAEHDYPTLVFADAPRTLHTSVELAAWKSDPERSNSLAVVLRKADAILKAGVTPVPEKESQWIFYYACPNDNTTLRAETPERHVCPSCKKIFEDERTIAAYQCVLNNRMENEIAALALAYALTGESRYAMPVKQALCKLAELYPTWQKHDRWGRRGFAAFTGGRRYCQLLDEAVGLISLAKTYDLLANAPCISEKERETIENGLLRYVARDIQARGMFAGGRNNHQSWFNASCAVAGLALADEKLLAQAVYGPAGLLWQLEKSVTSDGIWYEGTISYHFYAVQAICETLDAAKRAGWLFTENVRLKSLWLGPLAMAWPDGSFPAINDGDPTSLKHYRASYKWAGAYFNDEALKNAATNSFGASTQSALLPEAGLAVLRRNQASDPVCAMLDYGEHGGHHGHPDKLNLMLFARGREFLLDPGRLTYSVPEYESWCRTTVAHNTLVINGKNQTPTTGTMLFFTNASDHAACLAQTTQAYAGWEITRFLVLTDSFLLDLMAARGPEEAELDWLAHVRGKPEFTCASEPYLMPLGQGHGYQHLREITRLNPSNNLCLNFSQQQGRVLRMLIPDAKSDDIFLGSGIGYSLKDKVPFLLLRKRAKSALFVAVYEWPSEGNQSLSVQQFFVQDGEQNLAPCDGAALEICGAQGNWRIACDMRSIADAQLTAWNKPFTRLLIERIKTLKN